MKILIDVRLLKGGRISGIEEYTRHIVRALLERDTKDTFLFFHSGLKKMKLPDEWSGGNANIIEWRVPNKLLELSMWVFGWPTIDTKLNSDIVFSPHFNFLPKPKNARRIITFHDLSFVHFPEFYSPRSWLWHWQQNYAKQAREADAIIAVSEFTRQDIIKTLGVEPEKVHTIYSGINPFYRKAGAGDKERARFLNEKKLTKPFLLFVGTLEPRKNISGIIRAFDTIKNDPFNRELQLIIVGKEGWLCDTIFKDVREAKWASDIVLWGEASYEDLRMLYATTEAFVYPSFLEGFGFPPLEAQACGAPVITSNRSSLPEIMGDSALLVDPWKTEELVEAMQLVLKNVGIREELIRKGAKNCIRFDWENTADALLKVIKTLE